MHHWRGKASFTVLAILMLLVALSIGLAACGSETSDTTATTAAPAETTAPPSTEAETTTTEASPAAGAAITVSAASSLKAAFTEIGAAFDQANGSTTTFNFDASGTLQKQIEGGAPVDVFASAAPKQVNALLEQNLMDEDSVQNFAGNEIVIVVPADSTLSIASFEDLAKSEVKRITYGDPAAAPHGVAAEEILTHLNLIDQVKPKVIYAANVSQALTYVTEGEVDAGILFASEGQAGGDKVKVVATSQPDWHSTIVYPLGIVSKSEVKPAAQAFIDFVLSPEGQSILQEHGFQPAPTA